MISPWTSGSFTTSTRTFRKATTSPPRSRRRLKELQALFDSEARKYEVFPLDDRFVERGINPDRPSVVKGRTSFTYSRGNHAHSRGQRAADLPALAQDHGQDHRAGQQDRRRADRDRRQQRRLHALRQGWQGHLRLQLLRQGALSRRVRHAAADGRSGSRARLLRRSRSSNSSKARADRRSSTSMASWRAKATSPMWSRDVSPRPKPWTSAWTSGRRSREDYHDKAPVRFHRHDPRRHGGAQIILTREGHRYDDTRFTASPVSGLLALRDV